MQTCAKCGATLTIGASDCAACGTAVRSEPPRSPPPPQDSLEPGLGVAANLWRGNYTLFKTYWLFGLLGGLALGITVGVVLAIIESPLLALSGLASLWAWQVFISVAVWRSAGKYTGAKIWSTLARIAIFVGFFQLYRTSAEFLGVS